MVVFATISTPILSKFLNDLLQILSDRMASKTTVTSSVEPVQKLKEWLMIDMCQAAGVFSLEKILNNFNSNHTGRLKVETMIKLSGFVM